MKNGEKWRKLRKSCGKVAKSGEKFGKNWKKLEKVAEVRKSGEKCWKVMESGEKWGKFLQLSSLCFFTVVVGWIFYSCRQISFFYSCR